MILGSYYIPTIPLLQGGGGGVLLEFLKVLLCIVGVL